MLPEYKKKKAEVHTVLKRMREAASLTMRQAGGIVGVSPTISQFENGKLRLPGFRIDQMIAAYGYTQEDFEKIMGRVPLINALDDCRGMLEKMDESRLLLLRSLMLDLLKAFSVERET